jgi:tetratricopeptide (TPR) repeat protein/DNA-binding winged helix-turn-helix (wHTH) protein
LQAFRPSRRPIRFGVFELDASSGELRKQGVKIKLQEQPFQILQVLLERPGELVTREELQSRIWASDTFVDFEKGLYNAVKKLREALGDEASTPRFIETLPKRGYRFIAPLNGNGDAGGHTRPTLVMPDPADAVPPPRLVTWRFPRRRTWQAASLVFTATLLVFAVRSRIVHSSGAMPGEKRVAVLPLDLVGKDELVRALADGLVETMTSKLSQIESFEGKLMVVPASEVRSRGITSAEAARRIYGANLVITGSAQRLGDRIQFTLNLVDTASIRQIDSRTFEMDTANPIALRDEVTDGAIQMLALKLSPEASGSIGEGETSSPAAYSSYLKGIGYLARYDQSGNLDHAIESLADATRSDPRYALAFAALGRAHWMKAKRDSDSKEKDLAVNTILESIRLAPRLAEAHVRLGEIYADTGRIPEAVQEEWSALRIAPGNADAYRILGGAYSANGQYEQAEAVYREAVRRQPGDWYGHLMLGLFYSDRGLYKEAHKAFQSALNLTPDNEVIYRNLAVLDMQEGRFREASDTLAKTVNFQPNELTYLTLGVAYYYQRRYAEAAAAYKSGIDIYPGLYSLWGNLGSAYRQSPGDQQKAGQAFRKAIELAEEHLKVVQSDNNTRASLAEYWASLGQRDKALDEINKIPEQSRAAYADRIALAYELTGDRSRAVKTLEALPPDSPQLVYIRNMPDLEPLWHEPVFQRAR